jgi:hypothetical protein
VFKRRLSAEMIRNAVKGMAAVAGLPVERFSRIRWEKAGCLK